MYLSQKEVCEKFHLSRTTLYRREKEGLPSIKIGKQKRYDEEVVKKWLENQQGNLHDVEIGSVYYQEELVRMLHCQQTGFLRQSHTSVASFYVFLHRQMNEQEGIYWHWRITETDGQQIAIRYADENEEEMKYLSKVQKTGKKVYLFEYVGKLRYRFLGEIVVAYSEEKNTLTAKSLHGFPMLSKEEWDKQEQQILKETYGSTPLDMTDKPYSYIAQTRCVEADIVRLNPLLEQKVIQKAKGVCAYCGQQSPFQQENGEPLLEVYSSVPVQEASMEDLYAVDPLCHRRLQLDEKAAKEFEKNGKQTKSDAP